MGTVTVNISFQKELLADIDAEAKRESRSRSELVREAARLYVERQREWEEIFRMGDEVRARAGVTEEVIEREIQAARRERRARARG